METILTSADFKELTNKLNDSVSDPNMFNIFNDFLDALYSRGAEKNIFSERVDLSNFSEQLQAYFVASFHYLAHKLKLDVPDWFFDGRYKLEDPMFASGVKGRYRIILLAESPVEYRMRNIYVDKEPLRRV